MNIALIDGDTVVRVGDYRSLFPHTSFGSNGPSDEFLTDNSAKRVNLFRPYDRATQKLVACDPVIEGDWVYTVAVEALTQDEIDARNDAQWVVVRADRDKRLAESDWTQLPDSSAVSADWTTYRQALRDITTQTDPFNIAWPSKPDAS
jgi:hypothetical protein